VSWPKNPFGCDGKGISLNTKTKRNVIFVGKKTIARQRFFKEDTTTQYLNVFAVKIGKSIKVICRMTADDPLLVSLNLTQAA
jgi:hypothetical protein